MFDSLLALDYWLFDFIHNGLASAWADAWLPWWRDRNTWFPFYAFLLFYLLWKYRLAGVYYVVLLVAAAGLADIASSHIVKQLVMRVRPCAEPALADIHRMLMPSCGGYSFTSSHATNHFALATMLYLVLRPAHPSRLLPWLLYFWAASIALGQVYVGVHYPSDIVAGALLGSFLAYLLYRFLGQRFPWR